MIDKASGLCRGLFDQAHTGERRGLKPIVQTELDALLENTKIVMAVTAKSKKECCEASLA
ncbi:MAG: hypothetical protein LBJ41_12105 [Treponema sp.]|jgi:hypothetical protein|nr:hypothetical protein [Treponema sp.]